MHRFRSYWLTLGLEILFAGIRTLFIKFLSRCDIYMYLQVSYLFTQVSSCKGVIKLVGLCWKAFVWKLWVLKWNKSRHYIRNSDVLTIDWMWKVDIRWAPPGLTIRAPLAGRIDWEWPLKCFLVSPLQPITWPKTFCVLWLRFRLKNLVKFEIIADTLSKDFSRLTCNMLTWSLENFL